MLYYILIYSKGAIFLDKLIKLLKTNARISDQELAVMLGISEEEFRAKIKGLEDKGIIKGYSTIFDEETVGKDDVMAVIELKVTPKAQVGYDEIAKHIAQYPEVESVYLVSGGYDLSVMLRCHSLKEVSDYVAQRLATIDGVVSTTTHFFLQKYKESGIMLVAEDADERIMQ